MSIPALNMTKNGSFNKQQEGYKMSIALPQQVVRAWAEREGPVVLVTVDEVGMPNAIYASIAHRMADGRLAVADNYFSKTAANVRKGGAAGILFITKGHTAYQVKGRVEYYTDGPLYDEMLTWADPAHPRKGVAVINTDEVYSGSQRIE